MNSLILIEWPFFVWKSLIYLQGVSNEPREMEEGKIQFDSILVY